MAQGTVTLTDDPRILPVGRILRKVKLKELPQLWNVLEGGYERDRAASPATVDHSVSGGEMTMKEHETVVLRKALPEEGLEAGDAGAIVHVYPGGRAYEVDSRPAPAALQS
jgi:hypothetical protein